MKRFFLMTLMAMMFFFVFYPQDSFAQNQSVERRLNEEYSYVHMCKSGILGYYFQVCRNGYMGICDKNGVEVIAADEYDHVMLYESYGDKIEHFYAVRRDRHIGACDKHGVEIVSPDKYNSLVLYKSDHIGYYFIGRRGEYEGLCYQNGTEIFTPDEYNEVFLYDDDEIGYYFIVGKYGSYGVCNKYGIEIIPCDYYMVEYASGHFKVKKEANSRYEIYDLDLSVLF